MDFSKLYSKTYLFDINRLMIDRSDKLFLMAGACLLVLAIVFKLAVIFSPNEVDKKYRQRFFNAFLTAGLAEVAWFGFRYQDIPAFGTHFVALLILLIGLVWLAAVGVKMAKNYRAEKQSWEKGQVKLKYLPK